VALPGRGAHLLSLGENMQSGWVGSRAAFQILHPEQESSTEYPSGDTPTLTEHAPPLQLYSLML
jgi:hypothetical protein